MKQERVTRALGELIGWLETWRDECGAYNGFVVHRTEAKRMDPIHDTAWTQAAMIRGYGNLYRKSIEPRWGQAMTLAADLLASRYDPQTGKIHHTGHEDERFHSLVHCALAVCALLSVSDLVDPMRRERYIQVATEHVNRYWFGVLWVEKEGAFKFNEIDFFSSNEDRFVVNFNTMAAEALLQLSDLSGDKRYRELALRIGQWLIERWNHTQAVNERLLEGRVTAAIDPHSGWMAPGGFSYQFTSSQREPDNYVTLYTGLSLRGLWALYRATESDHFAQMIRSQCQYLLAMRDPETRLFYHTAWQGSIEKYPLFVSGAGMTLLGLHEVLPLFGGESLADDTLQSILNRVYPNGAYPGFIGKNYYGDRKGGGVVWEDVASTVNWNAQLFEYLTRLIENPATIRIRPCAFTFLKSTWRFVYIDSPASALIVSWWPLRSAGLYLMTKKRPKALLSIDPIGLYRHIRSALRRSS